MRAAILTAGKVSGYTGLLSLVRGKGRQGGGKLVALIPAAGVWLLPVLVCSLLYGGGIRGGQGGGCEKPVKEQYKNILFATMLHFF